MAKSKQPDFSLELFNTIAQESMKAKRRALNHRTAKGDVQTRQTPVLPEEPEEAPAPEACDAPEEEAPFFPQAPGMEGQKCSSKRKPLWQFWCW